MRKVVLYSPVQETASLFLNATLEKFEHEKVDVVIISNSNLNLGFSIQTSKFKSIECKGDNRNPLTLFSDLALFNIATKDDLLIFNGSTSIILSLLFKIIKPFNTNVFILHGTLKSKGKIINAAFLSCLFFASIFGVNIYSVNNRFKRFFLRKSKFHFLGIAGVGVRENAIHQLMPNDHFKKRNDKKFKIAFIGRKEISKGYDIFVDIAAANVDVDNDFISIGSEGDVEENCNPSIIHFGPLSQDLLFQKLKEIDILILPSKSEGLGMVMVECCIAGIPTITSKTDGSLQFIKQNLTGIIVKRNDIKSYLDAIQVIKSNYQFYSQNCIKYSIENSYFISKPIQFNW